MNKHQQTIYGIKTLLHMLTGIDVEVPRFTTANERLNILPDESPTPDEKVTLNTLIVGNKGHTHVPGMDGIALTSVNDHMANDSSLYNQLPFAMVEIDEDLSPAQRELYCLRKQVQVDGKSYFAYYGLRINLTNDNTKINLKRITKVDGVEHIDTFTPNSDNLFPTPPELPDIGGITSTNVSMRAEAIITLNLSPIVIERFVEAVKTLYNGDERYAVISEFGLCTSALRRVTVQSSNGPVNFTETIGTTVYAFTMEHKALFYNTQELLINFDLGNQIPLFGSESLATVGTYP